MVKPLSAFGLNPYCQSSDGLSVSLLTHFNHGLWYEILYFNGIVNTFKLKAITAGDQRNAESLGGLKILVITLQWVLVLQVHVAFSNNGCIGILKTWRLIPCGCVSSSCRLSGASTALSWSHCRPPRCRSDQRGQPSESWTGPTGHWTSPLSPAKRSQARKVRKYCWQSEGQSACDTHSRMKRNYNEASH